MAERKKGFIYKMVVGGEKDEDYARSTLPTSRWSLFWDVLKGRLGKLVLVNLLMLLFLAPLFACIFLRSMAISAVNSSLPFIGNAGVGYPAVVDIAYQQIIQINSFNNLFALCMIAACVIASFGISGGFYIMRNIVWTEGVFVANDFWRGIKKNILPIFLVMLVIAGLIYVSVINFNAVNISNYLNGVSFWTVLVMIATISILCFMVIMLLYMISFTVTYKLSVWQLLKNSFIMTVGLLPQNIFFIILGASPFLIGQLLSLLLGSQFATTILVLVYIFIGISLFVLVWTNFTQWAFDKFVNDNVEGAVKNRGIYPKYKDDEIIIQRKKAEVNKFKNPKKKRAIQPITDKEVELTDLSSGFRRSALEKLDEEKTKIKNDADKYAEAYARGEITESEEDVFGDDEAFTNYDEAMKLEGWTDEDVANLYGSNETKEDEDKE